MSWLQVIRVIAIGEDPVMCLAIAPQVLAETEVVWLYPSAATVPTSTSHLQ
jgi:hypothetical protein